MRLTLDPALVARARDLAAVAGRPVLEMTEQHTTVSIERAVLRMAGLEGADPEGIPWVNRLVDTVADQVGLAHGVALPVWDALAAQRRAGIAADDPLLVLAQRAAAGSVTFRVPEGRPRAGAAGAAIRAARAGVRRVDRQRAARDRLLARYPVDHSPWLYLIVATGDIDEDVPQAQAAAREGAISQQRLESYQALVETMGRPE